MAVRVDMQEGIHRIRLVRGRGNALDPATLAALEAAFAEAGRRPVLLTGAGRSFCTGLDLAEAVSLDRPAMGALMEAFHRALRACFLHPAPVVAALNGHALAGGALLALACDRRRMAEGPHRFGIHGVHLGVSYPQVAVEILRHQLSRRAREEVLYGGRIVDGPAARERGLVDGLEAPSDLEERAAAQIAELLHGGPEAFALAKSTLRARAAARLRVVDGAAAEAWLDQWFRPTTRARVRRAAAALGSGGRSGPGAGQDPRSGRV